MTGSKCSYFHCGRSRYSDRPVRIHTFPWKNAALCKKWVYNSGNFKLAGLQPKELRTKYICSLHFGDNDYQTKERCYLKKDAVPFRHYTVSSEGDNDNDNQDNDGNGDMDNDDTDGEDIDGDDIDEDENYIDDNEQKDLSTPPLYELDYRLEKPVAQCCLCGIDYYSAKDDVPGEKIIFFKFPREQALAEEWIKVCAQTKDFNYKDGRVCSTHFTKDDYADKHHAEVMGSSPKCLNKFAIPSLRLSHSKVKKEMEPLDDQTENKGLKRIKLQEPDESIFVLQGSQPPVEILIKQEPNEYQETNGESQGSDTDSADEISLEEKVQTLQEENFKYEERIEKLENRVKDLENKLEEFLNSKRNKKRLLKQ